MIAVTVAAVTGPAVAVSCGVPEQGLTVIEPSELPEALHPSSTTTVVVGTGGELAGAVQVYWIRDNRLVPESIAFESTPGVARITSILERGPGPGDRPDAERSLISQGDVIREVERDDEQAVVELDTAFAEAVGTDQVLALGQIVTTLTSVPGVQRVEFRQRGEPIDVPLPDGTLVRRALTRADYSSLIDSVEPDRVPTRR